VFAPDGRLEVLATATGGSGFHAPDLGVLAAWGAAGLIIATGRFNRLPVGGGR
jgi:hypothetical protein